MVRPTKPRTPRSTSKGKLKSYEREMEKQGKKKTTESRASTLKNAPTARLKGKMAKPDHDNIRGILSSIDKAADQRKRKMQMERRQRVPPGWIVGDLTAKSKYLKKVRAKDAAEKAAKRKK